MFREWGFLISEMIALILLAALLGLLVGWLIWGRRSHAVANTGEADRLRADLETCRASHAEKDARISGLEAAVEAAHASGGEVSAPLAVSEGADESMLERGH